MIRQQTVQVLLEWIEQNLEQSFSIDEIARKSGYSRRNIQLIFKNLVGIPLGAYIRRRKLCRAAGFVRLTSMRMSDIASLLHFNSQQAFCKEFKKLFGCSPKQYRNRDFWDLAYLCPSWLLNQGRIPECRIINLEEKKFRGRNYSYNTLLQGIKPQDEVDFRRNQLARDLKLWTKDIFCLSTFTASPRNFHVIFVETFSGIECDCISTPPLKTLTSPAGLYASFHYEGPWETYAHLPRRIYLETLPVEGLVRVNGHDIEHFSAAGTTLEDKRGWVICDFYVPVRYRADLSTDISSVN